MEEKTPNKKNKSEKLCAWWDNYVYFSSKTVHKEESYEDYFLKAIEKGYTETKFNWIFKNAKTYLSLNKFAIQTLKNPECYSIVLYGSSNEEVENEFSRLEKLVLELKERGKE